MNEVIAGPHVIGPMQLAISLVFVCIAGGISIAYQLGLAKTLLVGTVRTFAQLFLMGYALKYIFQLDMGLPVVCVLALMIAAAAHIVYGRVPEKDVAYGLPVFGAMLASYIVVTIGVTSFVVGAKPWWEPQYFLTLGGMIAGNSMNALAISLERLFSNLRQRREEVEMKLTLGADYREASNDIAREAIRAGMIPSINAMMGVGLVSIPGMMTGQIIAGADPAEACKYQIVVMLMLTASTAISSILVVFLARKMCFGKAQQLVLKPEHD